MKKRRARRNSADGARKSRKPGKNKGGAHATEKRATDRGATSSRGVHLSIQQAAEEFGHNWKTIQKRIREIGIQADGERQGYAVYRLRDLLAIERTTEAGKIDPEKLNPFERHAYYKAESEMQRVAIERGRLLRREDVEHEWSRILGLVAQDLEVAVDQIERDVGPPGPVLEALELKLDAIRERLYQRIVDNEDPNGEPPGKAPDVAAVPATH